MWLVETHYIVGRGSVEDLDAMLFFVGTGLAGKGFTAPDAFVREATVPIDWGQAYEGIGYGESSEPVDAVIDRLTLGSGENEVVK